MSKIVDRAYLEINGKTIDCISIDDSLDTGKEQRSTMNKENRSRSHKHGIPKFNLKVELYNDHNLSIDFWDLAIKNTEFSAIKEEESPEGSRIITYTRCEVYKVDNSTKDGESTLSIEIGALDRKLTAK